MQWYNLAMCGSSWLMSLSCILKLMYFVFHLSFSILTTQLQIILIKPNTKTSFFHLPIKSLFRSWNIQIWTYWVICRVKIAKANKINYSYKLYKIWIFLFVIELSPVHPFLFIYLYIYSPLLTCRSSSPSFSFSCTELVIWNDTRLAFLIHRTVLIVLFPIKVTHQHLVTTIGEDLKSPWQCHNTLAFSVIPKIINEIWKIYEIFIP